jgi:hypothetical protein
MSLLLSWLRVHSCFPKPELLPGWFASLALLSNVWHAMIAAAGRVVDCILQ